MAEEVWESVRIGDTKSVYRQIVCSGLNVNGVNGQALHGTTSLRALAKVTDEELKKMQSDKFDDFIDVPTKDQPVAAGCSLLHLACLTGGIDMIELLLQYGANRNVFDSKGRTPFHYCFLRGKSKAAKLLLTRLCIAQRTCLSFHILL